MAATALRGRPAAPSAGRSELGPGLVCLGLALAGLIGSAPLEVMLPSVVGVATLVATLIAPVVGLYALLIAVPFSPTLGVEGAEFSISAVEPLAFVTLLIWLAWGVARREITVPASGLLAALFCLLCVLLVAATGATNLPLAIKESLKWLLLTLAFVFTEVHVRGEAATRRVLAVLFFAGSGQALMGVVQFLAGYGPPTFAVGGFMRAHGNFGQPNPFAGYLGTIFPLALALAAIPHPRSFRLLAIGTVLCTGLAIALSLSRGAWLGLLIALAAMALAWSGRTRRLVAPTVVGLFLVGLLGILGALPPAVAARVTSVASNFGIFDARGVAPTPENFAVVERMAHWQAGWQMFLDHPVLGVGPGNYPAVYEDYELPGWREPLGHAHNYYLNMAAEAGLLGLAALLLTLLTAFRTLLRGLRTSALRGTENKRACSQSSFGRALAIGLLGSLVVFCTHNVFDNLLVHGVGIQVGMLLGLVGGLASR